MRVPHLPQPPGPGVRHVHADPGQQRSHLSRAAQVGGDARRRVPQHLRVAGRPQGRGFGVAARPGPDETGQHLLRDRPVHRQTVRGQLGAQQFGGGLAAGRRDGHRPFGQRGQRRLLLPGDRAGQSGPPGDPLRAVRPAAADPLGAQVPVRRHRIAAVAAVHAEQVERAVGRHRLGGQARAAGPTPSPDRPAIRRTADGAPPRYPSTWPAGRRRPPAAPRSGPTTPPTAAAAPRPPARLSAASSSAVTPAASQSQQRPARRQPRWPARAPARGRRPARRDRRGSRPPAATTSPGPRPTPSPGRPSHGPTCHGTNLATDTRRPRTTGAGPRRVIASVLVPTEPSWRTYQGSATHAVAIARSIVGVLAHPPKPGSLRAPSIPEPLRLPRRAHAAGPFGSIRSDRGLSA